MTESDGTTTLCDRIARKFAMSGDGSENEAKEGQQMAVKVEMEVPKVHISREAMYKLQRYIDFCPIEIAGLGKSKNVGDAIEVYDIFSLPQVATGGSAEIDIDTIAEYITGAVERGEPTEDIKVWWHSHVGFGAHWSGIDIRMANAFSTGYMVGILGNKQYDFVCRVDVYKPFRVTALDIPLNCPELERIDKAIQDEIEQNVRHGDGWRR